MVNKYEYEARIFRAFGDPNRLMIIEILQSGEKCACKLLEDLNIVQSTLSHHMRILCETGLVDGTRNGKWMHYSLNKQGFENAQKIINELSKNMFSEKI